MPVYFKAGSKLSIEHYRFNLNSPSILRIAGLTLFAGPAFLAKTLMHSLVLAFILDGYTYIVHTLIVFSGKLSSAANSHLLGREM